MPKVHDQQFHVTLMQCPHVCREVRDATKHRDDLPCSFTVD